MKKCSKCGVEKPISSFWPDKRRRSGLMARCKSCKLVDSREYRKGNKEKCKEIYAKGKHVARNNHILRKYGISQKTYTEMFIAQKGRCAVCGSSAPAAKALDVDHCHTTGVVRGLLCSRCNRMVGYAKDDVAILQSAIEYLSVRP